jgi:hypothetical protein
MNLLYQCASILTYYLHVKHIGILHYKDNDALWATPEHCFVNSGVLHDIELYESSLTRVYATFLQTSTEIQGGPSVEENECILHW